MLLVYFVKALNTFTVNGNALNIGRLWYLSLFWLKYVRSERVTQASAEILKCNHLRNHELDRSQTRKPVGELGVGILLQITVHCGSLHRLRPEIWIGVWGPEIYCLN